MAVAADPLIWVIVVTHNSESVVGDCLETLRARDNESLFKVCVVDSGSRNLSYLRALSCDRVFSMGNYGYGGAINVGAVETSSKWIVFMNPDVKITPDQLFLLVEEAEELGADLIGPRLEDQTDGTGGHFFALPSPPWRKPLTAGAEGAPLALQGSIVLVKRASFEALGGFDNGYFLYFEEVDFCLRALRAGFKVSIAQNVQASHEGEGGSGHVEPLWRRAQRMRGKARWMSREYTRTEAALAVAAELCGYRPRSSIPQLLRLFRIDPRRSLPKRPAIERLK